MATEADGCIYAVLPMGELRPVLVVEEYGFDSGKCATLGAVVPAFEPRALKGANGLRLGFDS